MRDRPLIVIGLVVFLGVATFPVWYNVAARADGRAPVLARPTDAAILRVRSLVGSGFSRISSANPPEGGSHISSANPPEGGSHGVTAVCVAPRDFMRASHMQLLATWREDVVRRGDRMFTAYNRFRYEKNLIGTCLGCHEDKAKFCDRCHDYAGVTPRCPDCHRK